MPEKLSDGRKRKPRFIRRSPYLAFFFFLKTKTGSHAMWLNSLLFHLVYYRCTFLSVWTFLSVHQCTPSCLFPADKSPERVAQSEQLQGHLATCPFITLSGPWAFSPDLIPGCSTWILSRELERFCLPKAEQNTDSSSSPSPVDSLSDCGLLSTCTFLLSYS